MSAVLKKTLTLKPKPSRDALRPHDMLRFIDKAGRYILQVKYGEEWCTVPFVGSLTAAPIVTP